MMRRICPGYFPFLFRREDARKTCNVLFTGIVEERWTNLRVNKPEVIIANQLD